MRNGAGVEALLEFVSTGSELSPGPAPAPAAEPEPFRTGLVEADLGLRAEERGEFE